MKLRDSGGGKINGVFRGFRNGSISGKVEGDVMTFTWNQPDNQQWGRGFFKMSPNGERLEGQWGYQKDYFDGGRWWASRAAGEEIVDTPSD